MHRVLPLLILITACASESPDRTVVVPNDDPASQFSYYELAYQPDRVEITGFDVHGVELRAMTAATFDPSVVARESLCSDCGGCATAMTVCYGGGSIEACSEDRQAWKLACGFD